MTPPADSDREGTPDASRSPPPTPPSPSGTDRSVRYALAGVVVGAILAGLFGLVTASVQLSGATEENLRNQRQVAYTQFLADNQAFGQAANQFRSSVLQLNGPLGQPPDFVAFGESYKSVDATYKRVVESGSSVSIIGTPSARAIAERISTMNAEIKNSAFAVNVVASPRMSPTLGKLVQKLGNELEEAAGSSALRDDIAQFIAAARSDVAGEA